MALVYFSRPRAISSSGTPIVGATLTVMQAGTTTPASIYRDAALSSPMTNPLSGGDASDSSGFFPQIFAAEGSLFDLTLKTSAGVTVVQEINVPALGTGTAAITRDFGSSRLRIAGGSGIVNFEGGDPSGDDFGGKVRVGGYNGTQADTISLDGLVVNVTGNLTVSKSAWLTLTDATTIAWDASLGFNARVTLTASGHTIGAPSQIVDGQSYALQVIQDATGSRTVSWNSMWDFGQNGTPVLSTGAGKRDLVVAIYDQAAAKLLASFRRSA